jgi:hypothetical protein
MPIL